MAASTHTLPQTRRPADRPQQADQTVNVGDLERWLSLLGGGLLALATGRRSLGTVVLLAGAGALLYRGWTGHCALYQTMSLRTAAHDVSPASPRRVAGPEASPLIVVAGS